MIEVFVADESSRLESVVLGTAESLGGTPTYEQAYDARSKESIQKGIYPNELDLVLEMESFREVLEKYGVKIYRPDLLKDTNQVYTRDIGFVIGDRFVFPNIISDREHEKEGIESLVGQMPSDRVVRMPQGVRAEGGDVIVWKNRIYVGYSEKEDFDEYYVSRTNRAGVDFLRETFPDFKLFAFELVKSDTEPRSNALHLDCCFQPLGENLCIICESGFKKGEDFQLILDHFGEENCFQISADEMYDMNSNVFSIDKDVVVSDPHFERLNQWLMQRGFTVEKVSYREVCKMGGLFRCSTLPLKRRR